MSTSRREFLQKTSALVTAALAAPHLLTANRPAPTFGEISLAQWSLHKALFKQELTNLDFPGVARQKFGITTVEYVNQFFKDKAKDQTYLRTLLQRCRDNGITNHLIMVDGEGDLGSPDERERQQAVEKHRPWLEAAAYLGCRSVRVNAFGKGTAEQVQRAAVAGLGQLSAYAYHHYHSTAQHLVGGAVVVVVGIHPVAPGVGPVVRREALFKPHGSLRVSGGESVAVKQNWKAAVGNLAVVVKKKLFRLHQMQVGGKNASARRSGVVTAAPSRLRKA